MSNKECYLCMFLSKYGKVLRDRIVGFNNPGNLKHDNAVQLRIAIHAYKASERKVA